VLGGNFGNPASVQLVFKTLAFINSLTWPLISLPGSIAGMLSAKVSCNRIDEFLNQNELKNDFVSDPNVDPSLNDFPIQVKNATFDWADEPEADNKSSRNTKKNEPKKPVELKAAFSLANINFKAEAGKLTAIVGDVGSGKSSLLAAVMGEMRKVSGELCRSGKIGYVAQNSWILNGTVRENILFGLPFDQEKYEATISCCALKDDLASFAAGDATEIGEKGINLSGGQKQRVAICRAVYSDADIYVFDDCLSAVDAHVGHEIFTQCLLTRLSKKTRIFVTNQIHFLHQCDSIYTLQNGRIAESGHFTDMLDAKGSFFSMMEAHVKELNRGRDSASQLTLASLVESGIAEMKSLQEKKAHGSPQKAAGVDSYSTKTKEGEMMTDEELYQGRTSLASYWFHIRMLGGISLCLIPLAFAVAGTQFASMYPTFWIGYWAEGRYDSYAIDAGYSNLNTFYIDIMLALLFATVFFLACRGIT